MQVGIDSFAAALDDAVKNSVETMDGMVEISENSNLLSTGGGALPDGVVVSASPSCSESECLNEFILLSLFLLQTKS
jgi:hypothetical protein